MYHVSMYQVSFLNTPLLLFYHRRQRRQRGQNHLGNRRQRCFNQYPLFVNQYTLFLVRQLFQFCITLTILYHPNKLLYFYTREVCQGKLMKTFGFEPKTFPLKEGHSTNRVLLSFLIFDTTFLIFDTTFLMYRLLSVIIYFFVLLRIFRFMTDFFLYI